MQEGVRVGKFQKYVRKILIFTGIGLSIMVWILNCHIFLSGDGFLIIMGTLTSVEDGELYYRYRAIVNGERVNIDLPKGFEEGEDWYYIVRLGGNSSSMEIMSLSRPLRLSGKRKEENFGILKDLREGIRRIEESESWETVEASGYHVRQLNMIYKLFCYFMQHPSGYHNMEISVPSDGGRFLYLPDYGNQNGTFLCMVISLAILIWLHTQCEHDKEDVVYMKNYNRNLNLKMLAGMVIVFWLSLGMVTTVL